ncbi:MAG TPA: acyltransferase [Caulobacteraceae bacterium]|jgi:peptidoglycan/LPS O-acetylase OafA/YrhL
MTDERSKWAVLALTRFILAGVVLVGHLNYLPGDHAWTGIGTFLNQGSAVYGFLVISGYSIAASLDRSPKGFFVRRVRRIWPTYLVSLLLAACVAASISHPVKLADQIYLRPLNWVELLATLTMTQTFLGPALSADGQVWTLAVEWWDYMAAPFLRRTATRIIVAILVISLTFFVLAPPPANPADSTGGKMVLILAWWWLTGFLFYRHRGTALGYVFLLIPPLIAAVDGWIGRAAIVGLVAVALCEKARIPKLVVAVFDWLGDVSYPLYLVHIPILWGSYLAGVYQPALIGAAAIGTAAVVLHLVDIPLRRPINLAAAFGWRRPAPDASASS